MATVPNKSIRQQIADEINSRLALITRENGYWTNLGKHVVEAKLAPDDVDEGICWRDMEEDQSLDAEDESWIRHQVHVDIDFVFRGGITLEKARDAIADIEKAIQLDTSWNGLAVRTIPISNNFEEDQKEEKIIGGTVKITIEYATVV